MDSLQCRVSPRRSGPCPLVDVVVEDGLDSPGVVDVFGLLQVELPGELGVGGWRTWFGL